MDSSPSKPAAFTLQQVLKLRNAPFIEAHAWAVAYQSLAHIRELFNGRSSMQFALCDLSSLSVLADGAVTWQTAVKIDAQSTHNSVAGEQQIRIGVDQFLETLGNELNDALCLNVGATRRGYRQHTAALRFSPALENLLNTLRFQRGSDDRDSNSDSDTENQKPTKQHSKTAEQSKRRNADCAGLMKICELRYAGCPFETRLDERRAAGPLCSLKCANVREHYSVVCRSLYTQTLNAVRQQSIGYMGESVGLKEEQSRSARRKAAVGNSQRRPVKPNTTALLLSDDSDEPDDCDVEVDRAGSNSLSDSDDAESVASSGAFTSVSQIHSVPAQLHPMIRRTSSEVEYLTQKRTIQTSRHMDTARQSQIETQLSQAVLSASCSVPRSSNDKPVSFFRLLRRLLFDLFLFYF